MRWILAAVLCLLVGLAHGRSTVVLAPRSGQGQPTPGVADIFDQVSAWPVSAQNAGYYEVAAQWFRFNPDFEIVKLLNGVLSAGLKLQIGAGVLNAGDCGKGIEGFNAPDLIKAAEVIKSRGFTIDRIAMDEPLYYGMLYNGNGACNLTSQQIAAGAAKTIAQVRAIFPGVSVIDEEPFPVSNRPDWVDVYKQWAFDYRTAVGSPLAGIVADEQWSDASWLKQTLSAEGQFRRLGIPFGIIYNANPNITGFFGSASASAGWVADAIRHYRYYEGSSGRPDIASIATWDSFPDHLIPEFDPGALTHIIVSYVGQQTQTAYDGTVCGVLPENTYLVPGQSIHSCNQMYVLTLQTDGNLVLYKASGGAIWATDTNGRAAASLTMQSDGNLVLYAIDGTPSWASSWSRPGSSGQAIGEAAYLDVSDDGNLYVRAVSDGIVLWDSHSGAARCKCD